MNFNLVCFFSYLSSSSDRNTYLNTKSRKNIDTSDGKLAIQISENIHIRYTRIIVWAHARVFKIYQ